MYLLFYGVILLLSGGHAQENGTTEVCIVKSHLYEKLQLPLVGLVLCCCVVVFFCDFFLFKEQGVFLRDILFLL